MQSVDVDWQAVPLMLWIQEPPRAKAIRKRSGETGRAFARRRLAHYAAHRLVPPLRVSVVQEFGMWWGIPFTGPAENHRHSDFLEHSSFESMRMDVETKWPKGGWLGTTQLTKTRSWGSVGAFYAMGKWLVVALLHPEPLPSPFRSVPPHAHVDVGSYDLLVEALSAAQTFQPPESWANCTCVEKVPEAVSVRKQPARRKYS